MNKEQIAKKNYLMRAYRVDQRIESKMEQIEKLHDLATKATVTYSDMPRNPNHGKSRLEDAVISIMELESEINRDMLELVGIKREITTCVKAVGDPELQLLLEMRYLNYASWDRIAASMDFSVDNAYKLHKKALDKIDIPESLQ